MFVRQQIGAEIGQCLEVFAHSCSPVFGATCICKRGEKLRFARLGFSDLSHILPLRGREQQVAALLDVH